MHYRQLTTGDRYTISSLRKQGFTVIQIASAIGRHRSTIYREINRNKCNDNRYRPSKASTRTVTRRSKPRRNRRFTHNDYKIISYYLRKKLSPFQISNTLYVSDILNISHETIYQHVWLDRYHGGKLHTHSVIKDSIFIL